MIEIFRPASREQWLAGRVQSIGASEAPALLGVHPFLSGYELWALKTRRIQGDEDSREKRRGRILEVIAAPIIAEDHPTWTVTHNAIPGGRVWRDPDRRLSCTPDIFAIDPERGRGVIQIKSVHPLTFRKEWHNEARELEPPLHAVCQAIQEGDLTGMDWAAVAPLIIDRGIDLPVIDVPIHRPLLAKINERAAEFWRMIDEGREPAPDYARDGETIARMYAADDGSEVDLSDDDRVEWIVTDRADYKAQIKDLEKRVEALDAEMKARMGNASVGRLSDGRLIKWRVEPRKGYEVPPSSPRVLRYPRS